MHAAAMSMWPKDEGEKMSDYIYSIWDQNSPDNMLKPWKDVLHTSIYDSQHIKSFMKDILTDSRVPNSGF